GVEVPMLHAICTATVEMTATAIGPATGAHVLGNVFEIRRHHHLATALGPFPGYRSRITGQRRKLPVIAGCVVADETVHGIFCLRWRLVHILPSITHMAGGAAGLIRDRHAAKTVDNLAFAQYLPGFLMVVEPGPVRGLANLLAGFGVTSQARGGDVFGLLERPL